MKCIFDKKSLICEDIKQVNEFARNFYFSDNLERKESQQGAKYYMCIHETSKCNIQVMLLYNKLDRTVNNIS